MMENNFWISKEEVLYLKRVRDIKSYIEENIPSQEERHIVKEHSMIALTIEFMQKFGIDTVEEFQTISLCEPVFDIALFNAKKVYSHYCNRDGMYRIMDFAHSTDIENLFASQSFMNFSFLDNNFIDKFKVMKMLDISTYGMHLKAKFNMTEESTLNLYQAYLEDDYSSMLDVFLDIHYTRCKTVFETGNKDIEHKKIELKNLGYSEEVIQEVYNLSEKSKAGH